MRRSAPTIVSAVAIAALATARANAALPSPAARCTGKPPDFASISASDAFARAIGDGLTLRFLDRLERTERTALSSLVDSALAQPAPDIPNVTDAAGDCRVADIPFVVRRAWTMERMRWHLPTDRAAAVLPHLGVAIDALARRDSLDPALVAVALAPFGTSVAVLQSDPTPPSSCAAPSDARLDGRPAQPYFPPGMFGNTSIDVDVALTPEGFVRTATFYQSTFDARRDAPFVQSAIAAAGVSSYLPEIVNCQPIGSRYRFRATYTTS